MNKEDVMNKKRYTVKWIALLMQAACLFFVFSGASYAAPIDGGCVSASLKNKKIDPSICSSCVSACDGAKAGGKKHDAWDKKFCEASCRNGGCAYNITLHPSQGPITSCFSVNMNHGQGIVRYMLIPLQFLITYVAYIMAFFFLAWGLYRLRHAHEGGGANRQASGVGSALCFFAAALLFQYQYAVKLVGTSFLGLPSVTSAQWW